MKHIEYKENMTGIDFRQMSIGMDSYSFLIPQRIRNLIYNHVIISYAELP